MPTLANNDNAAVTLSRYIRKKPWYSAKYMMAIVQADPSKVISIELKKDILLALWKHQKKTPNPLPKFVVGGIRIGVLYVHCEDANSAQWLRNLEDLSVKDMKFKVVAACDLLPPVRMSWKTLNVERTVDSKILEVLQRYNPTVNTGAWKVVYSKLVGPGLMYTWRIVLMDRHSAEVIKDQGYSLHAGVHYSTFLILEDKDKDQIKQVKNTFVQSCHNLNDQFGEKSNTNEVKTKENIAHEEPWSKSNSAVEQMPKMELKYKEKKIKVPTQVKHEKNVCSQTFCCGLESSVMPKCKRNQQFKLIPPTPKTEEKVNDATTSTELLLRDKHYKGKKKEKQILIATKAKEKAVNHASCLNSENSKKSKGTYVKTPPLAQMQIGENFVTKAFSLSPSGFESITLNKV